LRLTILQSALLFLTDALTFMAYYLLLFCNLFIPECYPSFIQIIRTHFNLHFIAGQNFNIIHTHLSRYMRYYLMTILKLYPEHCIAQCLSYSPVLLNQVLFCHSIIKGSARDFLLPKTLLPEKWTANIAFMDNAANFLNKIWRIPTAYSSRQ
jgi:hypothetical protein